MRLGLRINLCARMLVSRAGRFNDDQCLTEDDRHWELGQASFDMALERMIRRERSSDRVRLTQASNIQLAEKLILELSSVIGTAHPARPARCFHTFVPLRSS